MFPLERVLPLVFLVLGVTILFVTFSVKLKRDTQKHKKDSADYFNEEFSAYFTRKKEIPTSLFIQISLEDLPFINDLECKRLYDHLIGYEKCKMANLKRTTNLEIKQTYGIAQFEDLIQYERNYLTFMDILVKYGNILYEKAFILEAKKVLELALNYGCDLSKCYFILSDIYLQTDEHHLLENLAQTAHDNMKGSHYLTKVLKKIESVKQDIDS